MHALFEGLCPVHFRNILKLTSANATAPVRPVAAFTHNVLTIDKSDAIPEGMNAKDVKQIVSIHKLLTELLNGELNDPIVSLHK